MLEIRPIDFRQARTFVEEHHRHNKPPWGYKFSIACYDDDRLCGVVMCGRPVARALDDGVTLEINRNCTDGTYNACSILYGAACRAAKAMGYKRIVTYTIQSEPGTSLKASGWMIDKRQERSETWDRPGRPREITQITLFGESYKYSAEPKIRWVKTL